MRNGALRVFLSSYFDRKKKDFQALFQLFAPFQLLKNRAYDQLGETRFNKEIFNVNTTFC